MEYITKNDQPKVQLSTMNERMNNGHKLYIAAWTFEIFAAIIGILVAIVTGITSYKTFQNLSTGGSLSIDQWSDVILGFVPFIMVALAELLKIPMVYLVYINRHLITKLFFSVILIGLTFITFETVFNGFERQFNNITVKVRKPTVELQENKKKISLKENYIKNNENLSEADIEHEYYKILTAANKTTEKHLRDIDKQILQIKTNSGSQINSELDRKNKKIKDLIKKRNEKIKLESENVERTQKNIDKKNKNINERIQDNYKQIAINNNIIKDSLLCFDTCINAKNNNKNLNAEIIELKSQLVDNAPNLNNKIDDVNNEFQPKIDATQKDVGKLQKKLTKSHENNPHIKSLEQDKINIQKDHNQAIKESNNAKQQEKQRLQDVINKVSYDKSEIITLNDKNEKLRKEINKYNSLTQIYRLAARYMNFIKEPYECKNAKLATKSIDKAISEKNRCVNSGGSWQKTAEITASDVTSEAVSKVSLIWFGSLAFLVSIMGVVLAFGALILKHPNKKFHNDEDSKWSISKTIRGVFASILKKSREPKRIVQIPQEVIKEVPVDKVVFKEVPVEVIKKEIIHTPIYTNDADLLKFGTSKIKDILKDDNDK